MTMRLAAAAVGMLVAFVGCHRSPDGLPLTAPGDDARLGTVSASWQATEDERGFANAARLDEPEVRFRYRVDVHNGGDEKLFVRLDRFELVDEAGMTVAAAADTVECTLGPGTAEGAVAGDVWVRKRDAERVRDFRIRRFAAALDDEGRAQYRAWLLQGRPGDEAAVDQAIAREAAAKPCAG
jgi:hypothetical protein